MSKKTQTTAPAPAAPAAPAVDALAQEIERRKDMNYATDAERELASRVAIAQPKEPVKISKLEKVPNSDSRYYPQRFAKHPVNYSELHGAYAENDTLHCNLADRTFFVTPAGITSPVRSTVIEVLTQKTSPLVRSTTVKSKSELPSAVEVCEHGKSAEEICDICDAPLD